MSRRPHKQWRRFLEDVASNSTINKCIEGGGKSRPTLYIRSEGLRMYASRYVWLYKNGDPGDNFVLHTCDNNLCVNINHLYLGNQSRNMKDAFERKRHSPLPIFRGEKAHYSKLTAKKVRLIRKSVGKTQQELAKEFGVSQSAISYLLLRKSWNHIS